MRRPDHDVAIFWDYENCPAPSNITGYEVVNRIRHCTQSFGSIRLLKAYLEASELTRSLAIRSELQCSGVSLTDCPHNGRKDVADKMMMVDMIAYAIDNVPPSTIVLISGDRDFAYALATLRLRHYTVVLVTLQNTHDSLKAQASICLDWQDMLNADIRPCIGLPSDDDHQSSPRWSRTSLDGPQNAPLTPPYTTKGFKSDCTVTDGTADSIIPPCSSGSTHKKHPSMRSCNEIPQFTHFVPPPSELSLTISQYPASTISMHLNPDNPTAQASQTEASRLRRDLGNGHLSHCKSVAQDDLVPSSLATDKTTTTIAAATPGRRAEELRKAVTAPTIANSQVETQDKADNASSSQSESTYQSACASVTTTNGASSDKSSTCISPVFKTLVSVLNLYRERGKLRPLRSNLASHLTSCDPVVYEKANVKKFSHYVSLAEKAGIVVLGGTDGQAWISLHPNLCGKGKARDVVS